MLITPGGDIRSLWVHGCVPPERYFWAGSKTLADYRVWRLGGSVGHCPRAMPSTMPWGVRPGMDTPTALNCNPTCGCSYAAAIRVARLRSDRGAKRGRPEPCR